MAGRNGTDALLSGKLGSQERERERKTALSIVEGHNHYSYWVSGLVCDVRQEELTPISSTWQGKL